MPVYNAEKFISQTISSVINQTYRDFELIIINDGSTDRTESICKAFMEKDKRIVYQYQDNSGVSSARNRGISISKGQYIMFIDADDIYVDNMIERMLNTILDTNADIVKCSYRNKSGKKISDLSIVGSYDVNMIKNEIIPNILKETIKCYLWTLMIKKSVVTNFENSLSIYEDVLFYLGILLKSESIVFIDDVLYIYNDCNLSSLTHRSYKNNILNMLKTVSYFSKTLNHAGLRSYIEIIHSRIISNICNYIFMIQYVEGYNDAVNFFETISNNDDFNAAKNNYCIKYLSTKEKIINYTLLNKKYWLFKVLCLIKNTKRKRQL